jgi:FKBP-type peptidyl-prolyl cis-trans isomerase FklB
MLAFATIFRLVVYDVISFVATYCIGSMLLSTVFNVVTFLCFISLLEPNIFTVIYVTAGTNEEGKAYLEANRVKPGVNTLPSGLQYRVLESGTGKFHPGPSTSCSCHYAGTLIDGTTFDSSYDRGDPTSFAPNQVIKGWTEAMQLMVEGDVWELTIPSELAYGDNGSPPKIPGGSVLVFKLNLIEIVGSGKVPAIRCNATSGDGCNEKESEFLSKVKSWDIDQQQKELTRLEKIVAGEKKAIKSELQEWFTRRIAILKQLVSEKDAKGEEL